jgi:hypothetical protein
MMSRSRNLFSLPLFVVSLFGCNAEHESTRDGRLDLVIRPEGTAASDRPLQGRFVLNDRDGRLVDWIEVVNVYQTSRVTLPEGLYLFEWQPALPFEAAEQAAAGFSERSVGALPIPIAAGRVTTVNARATLVPYSDGELAARSEEIPSVEILISRR